LSDEGGGFDVGLSGLRAATKAIDGRGPKTGLTEEALRLGGGTFDGLREHVYGPGPVGVKVRVASSAESVVRIAVAGDPVARGIVDRAAREIDAGIRAVVGSIDAPSATLVMAGSMLTDDKTPCCNMVC
jgi:N-acetylglucosamine kinase-like BadF-type ATPase